MSARKGMLLGLPVRWDEACFAVPAVRALVGSGLVEGLAVRQEQVEFWKTVCDLPHVVFSDKTSVRKLAAEVRGEWDASLVWENGILAKVFTKVQIARRLGPENVMPVKWLTHPLDIAEGVNEHRVRRYLNTCERIGVETANPDFFAAAHLGILPEPGTVLLCPGSDFGVSYEWSLPCWKELGEALRAGGRRITVVDVTGGRGLGKALAATLGDGTSFFQAEPLANALPLLAVHEVTVAADGSLPHIAAYAGSMCVTLFGPNDAVWKRPLGKRHKIVKRHVECAPCLSARCLLDGRCQTELEVARVMAAITALTL